MNRKLLIAASSLVLLAALLVGSFCIQNAKAQPNSAPSVNVVTAQGWWGSQTNKNQSIPSNSPTVLQYDTWENPPYLYPDSFGRFIPDQAGWYMAGGRWGLASSQNTQASRVFVAVRKNGTYYIESNEVHTIANKSVLVSVATGAIWLNVGDYLEIVAWHDEGSPKTILQGRDNMDGWMQRIGSP
jgi:hypothetical protein